MITERGTSRRTSIIRVIGIAAGILLVVIGARFLLLPDDAAHTFGLAKVITGQELSYIIGLRDVWLGALAIAFAAMREWRALALWFGFGVIVCWSDAAIAAMSGGWLWPVAFHAVCGAACAVLAALTWRRAGGLA